MNKPNLKRVISVFLMLLISFGFLLGCSMGKKNILFVTKTSLGVDIDTKPPTIDIGYARKEATVSPKFEGGVLPQLASFKTGVGFVNVAVGQSIATGNAALLMSRYLGTDSKPKREAVIPLADISDETRSSWVPGSTINAKRYFFGTDTSFALKITFGMETGGYPDSLSLGYKREEMAFVPLMEAIDASGAPWVGLPSLVATADLDARSPNVSGTDVQYKQFYATGMAANFLAAQPETRNALGAKIVDDSRLEKILASREMFRSQRDLSEKIITAFKSLSADLEKQVKIFDHAISLAIIDATMKGATKEKKRDLFESRIVLYVNKGNENGAERLQQLEDFIEGLK